MIIEMIYSVDLDWPPHSFPPRSFKIKYPAPQYAITHIWGCRSSKQKSLWSFPYVQPFSCHKLLAKYLLLGQFPKFTD